MAKFCEACGTPCADNATFCAGCGKQLTAQPAPQQPQYQAPQQPQYQAPQQPQYQAPQQPQYQAPQQPQYQAPQQPQYQQQYAYQPAPAAKSVDFVATIRQYLHIIIIVVAAFALLTGILNLGGMYEVSQTSYAAGIKGPSADAGVNLLRSNETMEHFELYVISTYVIGIAGWIGAALLGFSVYMLMKKQAGSKLFFSLGSLIFAAGSLIALLMALFGGTYSESAYKVVIGVNWTYFVAVILGAGLVVIDKVLFKDDAHPLQ